ncbi:MAG: prepilin-type N-terminal cleavage/methylation domain-containing protein [Candidatus Paceibacterota bacterium]|jgi:prepilin-type N-terminal cleavage/methylation domain-containing protein
MINNKKTKGFTMAEVLVSVAIFSFLSIGLANVFVSAIKAQNKILQNQDIMEESNYALEYMGKALRMAKKDTVGGCTGTGGINYLSDSYYIVFLAYDSVDGDYKCRAFIFDEDDKTIKEYKSVDDTYAGLGSPTAMTSSKMKVNSLIFYVTGDGPGGQPKVTIMLSAEGANSSNSNIVIETTISQRELNTD